MTRDSLNGEATSQPFDMHLLLLGGIFGAAFYLIQAGIAEILLSRNVACLAHAGQLRIGFVSEEICMPEWQQLLLTGASNGVLGVLLAGVPLIGRTLTGGVYFLLGAVCSQLPRRIGLIVFFLAGLFMVAITALLSYLSQFVL